MERGVRNGKRRLAQMRKVIHPVEEPRLKVYLDSQKQNNLTTIM
jgi:hypothetical protein